MHRLAALAVVLAALLVVPGLAFGTGTSSVANSKTFQDATNEDPFGPDITTIAVSNDDTGLITFDVSIPNRPTFTQDMVLLLFLDTGPGGDKDTLGSDYAIQLIPEGGALFRWNGSDFVSDTPQASFDSKYASGVARFVVSAAELGGAKTVRFLVLAITGVVTDANGDPSFASARRDVAPTTAGGAPTFFTYEVKTTLRLAEEGFAVSQTPARAGGQLSAALAATRNDTKSLVRSGTVGCDARIGALRLAVVARRVRNGVATCVWRIPTAARGKTVKGTITLTVDGVRLARSFSARVGA